MASHQRLPQYLDEDLTSLPHPDNDRNRLRINRKPVPTLAADKTHLDARHGAARSAVGNLEGAGVVETMDENMERPKLPPRPELSLKTSVSGNITDCEVQLSPDCTDTSISATSIPTGWDYGSSSLASSLSSGSISSASTGKTTSSSQLSASSYMKKGYQEARHFAGGLIQRPSESTKHFTILRHSHGIVFYQGTSTSLAISIFADAPLPLDRTLWLQSKGWTGKTGMRARAFVGRNGNWLNVTPTTLVRAEQLDDNDERAWQRDFAKFRKKASSGIRENHVLRETNVVRIPAEAGDGYFQLVLCLGEKKKVLCPSPVFRVISTSSSPGSIRGASLSTLPLELGALALGIYGRSTIGNAVLPVTSVVQNQVQNYMPSWWTQQVASAAYGVGAQPKVNSILGDAESRYDQAREIAYEKAGSEELNIEQGPIAPYPIRFVAKCEVGIGGPDQFGLPTMSLTVPERESVRLYGYYFGWARLREKPDRKLLAVSAFPWSQAVISATLVNISQLSRVDMTQARKKNFTLHLITDFDDKFNDHAEVEVQVMGFIRPDEPAQRAHVQMGIEAGDEAAVEASVLTEVNDVSIAQRMLDHPLWAPEGSPKEKDPNSASKTETVKNAYTGTRLVVQRQIDRVPFHKIGVRVPVGMMVDETMIRSGFYVER